MQPLVALLRPRGSRSKIAFARVAAESEPAAQKGHQREAKYKSPGWRIKGKFNGVALGLKCPSHRTHPSSKAMVKSSSRQLLMMCGLTSSGHKAKDGLDGMIEKHWLQIAVVGQWDWLCRMGERV